MLHLSKQNRHEIQKNYCYLVQLRNSHILHYFNTFVLSVHLTVVEVESETAMIVAAVISVTTLVVFFSLFIAVIYKSRQTIIQPTTEKQTSAEIVTHKDMTIEVEPSSSANGMADELWQGMIGEIQVGHKEEKMTHKDRRRKVKRSSSANGMADELALGMIGETQVVQKEEKIGKQTKHRKSGTRVRVQRKARRKRFGKKKYSSSNN